MALVEWCGVWHAAQLAVSTVELTCGDAALAIVANGSAKHAPTDSTHAAAKAPNRAYVWIVRDTTRPIRRVESRQTHDCKYGAVTYRG